MRSKKYRGGSGSSTPVLGVLTLSNATITENSTAGTVVGAIQNTTAGSTLSLFDSAGSRFAISGSNIVAGATATDYETATSHNITIRETLAGAIGNPKDTVITITVINVLEVTLAALGGTFTLAENSTAGTVAGAITGKSAGSTLSLFDNAGGRVSLSGTNIVAGATATDYETATSHSFTIRETHTDGNNSPRDTVCTLNVTNVFEQPNLAALAFSNTTWTVGTSDSGTINNATSGSTISASGLPTGLTINGPARTWAWSGSGTAGTGTIVLTETLNDSANSPRNTNINYSISNGGAAFNPATLYTSGQVGPWLENDITTMFTDTAGTVQCTTAGDLIACWKDKSGNNLHFTQATSGNRPTLQQNANGKWYASFSGNQWLDSPNFRLVNTTAKTASGGIAANTSNFTSTPRLLSSSAATGHTGELFRLPTAQTTIETRATLNPATFPTERPGGTISTSTDFYATVIWQPSGSSASEEIWLGGSSDGSTVTASSTFNSVSESMRLGATAGTAANWLTGRVYGIVVSDAAWSSTERTGVDGYLNALFTLAADTVPDAFAFTDTVDVATSSTQTSNSITVSGINSPAPVTILDGEWEKNGSGVWMATGGTVVNGDTVRVRHTAATVNRATVNTTLTIGGVSDTFSSTTIATPTPTLTRTSADGQAPILFDYDDPVHGTGSYIHWEFVPTLTPSVNADGTFVGTTQYGVFFIDGETWANSDASLGFSTPAGPYSLHMRGVIDDPNGTVQIADPNSGLIGTYTAGAWSNVISDTITDSAALLTNITGAYKSRYMNVQTGQLQAIHNNTTVGSLCPVRADHHSAFTKFHLEVTVNGNRSLGQLAFGFDDGSINFNATGAITSGQYPGNISGGVVNPGVTLVTPTGNGGMTVYRNGSTTGTTWGNTMAAGYIMALEVDTVAKTIDVYTNPNTGTFTKRTTITLTSGIPAAWYFWGAGARGDGTLNLTSSSDAFTVNFGGTPFAMTPSAGFNNIYA